MVTEHAEVLTRFAELVVPLTIRRQLIDLPGRKCVTPQPLTDRSRAGLSMDMAPVSKCRLRWPFALSPVTVVV